MALWSIPVLLPTSQCCWRDIYSQYKHSFRGLKWRDVCWRTSALYLHRKHLAYKVNFWMGVGWNSLKTSLINILVSNGDIGTDTHSLITYIGLQRNEKLHLSHSYKLSFSLFLSCLHVLGWHQPFNIFPSGCHNVPLKHITFFSLVSSFILSLLLSSSPHTSVLCMTLQRSEVTLFRPLI